MSMRETVAVLGVPVDRLTMSQALDRIEAFIAEGGFHQVATANTDFIVRARRDPELLAILRECEMVVADGMPLVRASRWLGSPLPERVTGADMVPALAALSAERGYRLFLLGGREEALQGAQARLERDYPDIRIVGCISPPFAHIVEMDNATILSAIESAHPDILLVAFGNPKQEKWLRMHRHRLAVPVCIGVGGTFEFLAGTMPRAPRWMQRTGLEWLHRLIREPKRMWRRYGTDLIHFARLVVPELAAMHSAKGPGTAFLSHNEDGWHLVIEAAFGNSGAANARQALEQLDDRCREGITVDLKTCTALGAAGLGVLLELERLAGPGGLHIADAAPGVARVAKESDALDVLGLRTHKTKKPGSITVERQVSGSCVRLVLSGEASIHTMKQVETTACDAADASLVIDMKEVTFVDCGALCTLRHIAEERAMRHEGTGFVFSHAVRVAMAREGLSRYLDGFELIAGKA